MVGNLSISKYLSICILLLLAAFLNAQYCRAETQSIQLLPEFVNFPFDHKVLPPEYLKLIKSPQTDLRQVAASLLERKKQFILRWQNPNEIEESGKFPKSLDELELVCLFPEKYLDSLLSQGQLNVHQVGHSRGLCQKEIRAHAEDFMIGIHLENPYNPKADSRVHQIRPKYGFLNFKTPCGIQVNPFRLVPYGQILIVYNDEVKLRSSYSFGDSLASYCEPYAQTQNPLDPLPLTLLKAPGAKDSATCRYVEAQIWGPLDLSDIKEFRIPKDRKDLLEKLSSAGKAVFSYDREKMELSDLYVEVCEGGWQRGEALNAVAVELLKKEQLAQK
ncbi:MAG: hypothetical protein K2X27_01565 [Candidatus Obscuribacterales bacterium]|nr:hypothetical protein [Candidatus Obscuribacterales bacterium]